MIFSNSRDLNKIALAEAQKLFEATPQNNRRQNHASLQEKINTLLSDIRLYEKGIKTLPDSLQQHLLKYLLKSLGNDICNELTIYVAGECNLQLKNADNLNVDQRNKIAQECGEFFVQLLFLENLKNLFKILNTKRLCWNSTKLSTKLLRNSWKLLK